MVSSDGRLLPIVYGADFDTFPAPKDNRVTITITPHHVVANG